MSALDTVTGSVLAAGSGQLAGASSNNPASWLLRAISRYDPLLAFDWDVSMTVGTLTHKPEYVEAVAVPGVRTETEAIYRASTKIYIATTFDTGAVSVKLYEDVRFTSTKFLQSWRSLIHAPNGDHGLPVEYKGVIQVIPKTPTGYQIARLTCKGVFPTQHPNLPFGSDNERIALDVEFSCDRVEIEFLL
jgi:hypothetical protein